MEDLRNGAVPVSLRFKSFKKLTYITVNMRWLVLYTAETKKRVLTRSINIKKTA